MAHRGATAPIWSIATLTAIVLLAAAAWSPDAGAQAASGTAVSGPAAVSDQLEPVLVTASRKGVENIQDIPMAISAIDPASLERNGLGGLEDYAKTVPSLSLQQLGPGINKIDIRGITTSGLDYTDVQDRPLVTVYLDDTPISLQAQNPDLKVFDLERVEVLRGPQGTLYGAGAMSGTIRLITKKPDLFNFSGSTAATVSDTDSGYGAANYSVRQMVNVPLIDGVLAARAVVFRSDDSGFIKNVGLGVNAHRDVTDQARVAFRLKPNDGLTVDLSITYEDLHAGVHDAFAGLPAYQFTSLEPEITTDNLKIMNLAIEQDFANAILTSSTSFLNRNNSNLGANEYGVNAFLYFGLPPVEPALDIVSDHTQDFVEEIRLTSKPGGPLKWTGGVFYEHFKRHYYQDQPASNFDAYWGSVIGYPGYSSLDDGAFFPNDDFSGTQDVAERQLAVFGEATYTVLPKLDLTAGVRYFDWHQDFGLYFGGVFGASPGASSPTSPGVPLTENGTAATSGANPRFAASYHVDDDAMVFVEAARGFRYGGVNQPVPLSICEPYLQQIGLTQAPISFGPDKLWSYSLGEKTSMLNRRVQLNLTAFFIDWQDVQTTRDLQCSYYFIENKGHIQSKGLELESVAKLTPALSLSVNGSYTHAASDGLIENLNAPSGSQTPFDPRWIGNGALTYTLPVDRNALLFAANYSYRSWAGTTFNPLDSNYRVIPSQRSLDASVTYRVGTMQFGLFGSNLTNGTTVVNVGAAVPGSLQPGDQYFYARPRTVGLRFAIDY